MNLLFYRAGDVLRCIIVIKNFIIKLCCPDEMCSLIFQYLLPIFQQTAQELIDRRKKLLKYLRQYDYKKFEWLLEKLNIVYKAHPE